MSDRTAVERLRHQLDRVFAGEAWHGTPVLDVLDELTARQAAARPVASAHSIAEIVNHIDAWLSIVHRRCEGTPVGTISDAVDWPPVTDPSDEAWREARARLRRRYLELASMVSRLSDADLDRTVQGKLRTYTVYDDIHGVIQHTLYHLGQIVVLAKAASSVSGER
jgi:uncharacterized damage-inducible protein DinB